MATREEYTNCMVPYISGSKPKEQRKLDFCIGAKVCSGKAKSPEEAKTICLNAPPKEPKARKSRRDGCPPCPPCGASSSPVEENLPCPARTARVVTTIDEVIDKVKEGKADVALDYADLILKDVKACFPDDTVTVLANSAHDYLKGLGKGYYFKGEVKELKGQLDTLKVLIGG